MQKDRKKQQYLQRLKMLKTRINKGKTRMNKRKTRISAGFSLAEMEGFELWLDFLLCPKCTVDFVQTAPCFIEHRLADVGIAISYGI